MSTSIEKFRNKIKNDYIPVSDPTVFTDRMTDTVKWNDYKGWLLKLPIEYANGTVFVDDDLHKGLSQFYYVPDTVRPDDKEYDSCEQFLADVLTWRTTGAKGKVEDVRKDVLDELEVISNASGMHHALKDNEEVASLFRDICRGREHWDLTDLMARLVRIKGATPTPVSGKVGEIKDVSAAQYEAWASNGDSSKYIVGPYLLLKLAQQAQALQKLTEDGLTIQAGGTTLIVHSAFELEGDREAFARNFKTSGKQLAYSHIPLEGYLLAELFHRYYQLLPNDKFAKAVLYTPKKIEEARLHVTPPLFKPSRVKEDGVLKQVASRARRAVDEIAEQINKGSCVSWGKADTLIDGLARVCSTYLKSSGITEYKMTAVSLFNADLSIVNSLFEDAQKCTGIKDKAELMRTKLGVSSIQGAMELLASERKHRNVTEVAQYSYKNIGSLGGNSAYPALDTMLKGERIKFFLEKMLSVPLDRVVMYGAAYAHMSQPFKSAGVFLKLLDKDPAKEGAQVEIGNVYGIDSQLKDKKPGVVVIDDTMTPSNISESDANELKRLYGIEVNKGQTGDWNKLQKFVLCPEHTFVSKISLANVNESAFQRLFFPGSIKGSIVTEGPFKHVSLYKFGKFHNPEVFLVLSNADSAPVVRWPQFQYMVASCVMSVALANTVLQKMANAGAMAGTLSRREISSLWLKLLASLPIRWPWYEVVYRKEVKYGNEILSNVVAFDLIGELGSDVQDVQYTYTDVTVVKNPPK